MKLILQIELPEGDFGPGNGREAAKVIYDAARQIEKYLLCPGDILPIHELINGHRVGQCKVFQS